MKRHRSIRAFCVLFALFIFALGTSGCAGRSSGAKLPPGATSSNTRIAPAHRKASAIVDTARSAIGTKYKWGGSSPSQGFDCSGLVHWVYTAHGIEVPRVSWQQFDTGAEIPPSRAQAADLVFFQLEKKSKSLHVGILTGDGTFVHSPSSGKAVRESELYSPYWQRHLIGARRVVREAVK